MSKKPVLRQPLEVALLNLNGLGLGYIHARRWIRWVISLLIGIGILTTAFLVTSQSLREWLASSLTSMIPGAASLEDIIAYPLPYMPWLWAPIFLFWPLLQTLDGWLLAYLAARRQPGTIIPWRKGALIAGSLILLVMLFGVIGYGLLGQLEYSLGTEDYENNNFTTAQPHFDNMTMFYGMTLNPNLARAETKSNECGLIIKADKLSEKGNYDGAIQQYQSYLSRYSSTSAKPYVREKIAQAHVSLALGLLADSQYVEALDEYQIILDDYDDTPTGKQITVQIAETYTEWADQLRSEEKFQSAIDKYQYILNQYPQTPSASVADTEIPATYETWGFYLRDHESFQTAIEKFQIPIDNYPNSNQAASAPKNIADTYIAWGDYLNDSGDFIGAMEKYENAKQAINDTQVGAQSDQGYQTALHNLSHDSGSQGWMVINDATTDACNGRAAASPAIGLSTGESPKARLCHTENAPSYSLPYDLNASEPGHFFYVIKMSKMSKGISVVNTCGEYVNNSTGARYTYVQERPWWKAEVFSTLTGRLVKSYTFNGTAPSSSCPIITYLHPDSNGIIHEVGTEPNSAVVTDWLRDVMENIP